MEKSKWKIYQRGKDEKFWAIEVDRKDFSFEWLLNSHGDIIDHYWDKQIKSFVDIYPHEFNSGKEAADYIKEIERKKNVFYLDVTKEYCN
jgi:hypothetical protein